MYKTKNLPVVLAKRQWLYRTLLLFYPLPYQKQFAEEMFLTFQDMYQEELNSKGKVGNGFWISILADVFISVLVQHGEALKKEGMKNYLRNILHINKYNVIGAVLLFPFAFLLGSDFLSRLVQGSFSHPNAA